MQSPKEPIEELLYDQILRLLDNGPVAVNVGIQDFAESLEEQDVPVVIVQWSPPADGDPEMNAILSRIL